MFAIVRTGGKQYRVAPGDKIVVEKLAGNAGDSIDLTDVLLAGEGSDLKSTDGLIVSAEIIAQAKADKVTVFKKRRRHNYRRKAGHRQQHTILKIVVDRRQEGREEGRSEGRSGREAGCCACEGREARRREEGRRSQGGEGSRQEGSRAEGARSRQRMLHLLRRRRRRPLRPSPRSKSF